MSVDGGIFKAMFKNTMLNGENQIKLSQSCYKREFPKNVNTILISLVAFPNNYIGYVSSKL